MTTHKHIYIIGRLSDAENSHYTYHDMTLAEADTRFAQDIYNEDPEKYEHQLEQCGGCPVIYEAMLVSDSPITSLQ
jgi:hypothetical protein